MKPTPFHTSDGTVQFPWKPTGDRAFIFPSPPPETYGKGIIEIPEQFREEYRKGYGILLAVGPGFTDPKGRWRGALPDLVPGCAVYYDVNVPWRAIATGVDGKEYLVVLCGAGDIFGVENG